MSAVSTSMKLRDPYVLAAMDGLDSPPSESLSSSKPRAEPTALFFAIFGLICEALALSSADSTPSAEIRRNVIIALETLKSLVKPEYSGNALLESSIFDEFSSLCYRMAMTESASVQSHLVEVIASFAVSQKVNTIGKARYDRFCLEAEYDANIYLK